MNRSDPKMIWYRWGVEAAQNESNEEPSDRLGYLVDYASYVVPLSWQDAFWRGVADERAKSEVAA